MKVFRPLVFLLILNSLVACQNDSEPAKKKDSFINKVLKRNIGDEYTDSLALDKFIQKNPRFLPLRNKIFKFYSRRDYQLAWSEQGEFKPHAIMLINILRNADREGLSIVDFQGDTLYSAYELALSSRKWKKPISQLRKNIDITLTANFFDYSRSSWKGLADSEGEAINWHLGPKKIKFGKMLDSILDNPLQNPFVELAPLHQEYHNLLKALDKYRAIEKIGGWPTIKISKGYLKKGDRDAIIADVKRRLYLSGDLKAYSKENYFSNELSKAVKHFQNRHGLPQDGIIRGKTLQEMNIPVEDRITQMLINLERWRWVPEKIGNDYILVNIPEFKLRVYEKQKEIWNMKVIVGKKLTNTPIFNDLLQYIVLNPYWNVPPEIAIDEIVPIMRHNPDYLSSQNMGLYYGNDTIPTDPYIVNWDKLNSEYFPYTIRQYPGNMNALGKYKFLFPNSFDVYLHDTPEQYLFEKEKRDFSHGCIRLEQPEKLAEYLLRNNPVLKKIKSTASNLESDYWIKLEKQEQRPVYILYFTTWIEANGDVQFREDIYNQDKKLKQYFLPKDILLGN